MSVVEDIMAREMLAEEEAKRKIPCATCAAVEETKVNVPAVEESKLVKSFEAKDDSGSFVRVGIWSDGKVTICQTNQKEEEEAVCHTSTCKPGQDAQTCYEEAKKLFGDRFGLTIEEKTEESL